MTLVFRKFGRNPTNIDAETEYTWMLNMYIIIGYGICSLDGFEKSPGNEVPLDGITGSPQTVSFARFMTMREKQILARAIQIQKENWE